MGSNETFSKTYIYIRVNAGLVENQSLLEAWFKIPENLAFYNYISNNPAKGGIILSCKGGIKKSNPTHQSLLLHVF